MQNYYAIGKVRQAKERSFTNRTTGEIRVSCEVTLEFNVIDKNGESVLDMEHINFNINELAKFRTHINQFVAVPYRYISTKDRSMLFPDDDLPTIFFNHDPLSENSQKTQK
ncbi:MAG: hypothetical protein ACTTJS_05695 [Wolinella sp.]